jgi:hypothetical protein
MLPEKRQDTGFVIAPGEGVQVDVAGTLNPP